MAECLMPGVTEATVQTLSRRVREELARSPASEVSFLGCLLMPEDEVLLCLFSGTSAGVRSVSEGAGLPVERIVPCVAVEWAASGRR